MFVLHERVDGEDDRVGTRAGRDARDRRPSVDRVFAAFVAVTGSTRLLKRTARWFASPCRYTDSTSNGLAIHCRIVSIAVS